MNNAFSTKVSIKIKIINNNYLDLTILSNSSRIWISKRTNIS